MTMSASIHVAANGIISFFFMAEVLLSTVCNFYSDGENKKLWEPHICTQDLRIRSRLPKEELSNLFM